MTDSLKVFFSDVETATFLNLSRGIMPGHCNQSVTFALNNDSSKTPPVLLTIWEGSPDSSGKRSSEWIYMDPDDARSIAHVLIAYADAWQDRWDRFESGEDAEVLDDQRKAEPAIPRAENCGRYLAEINDGRLLYLNHANTWQECPNFISHNATRPGGRK